MVKKIIIVSVVIGFLLPNFLIAQNQPPKAPETLGEAETLGMKILKGLPQVIKEPWQEALRVWGGMWNWVKRIWNSYIFPWLKSIWQKISAPFIQEVERRTPIIEEEFKKEKQEMKEEIKTELPKTGKSLWERFKELIR